MQLNFQRQGDGFPLVILHGLFGSLDNWQNFSRQWSQFYQVITVDLRNHGRSLHADAFNYQVMADDLCELLAALELSRVHLLGHSLGGKAAMYFALNHPDKVQKLIVADMAPRKYPATQLYIFRALLGLNLGEFRERGEIAEALRPAIPELAMRQFMLKNITRDQNGAFQWKINLPVIYQNYAQLNEALTTEKTFDGPTLFIRGGRSDYITDSDEMMIKQLFPRAGIVTIPEAAHWVHADAPEKFSAAVLDFLK